MYGPQNTLVHGFLTTTYSIILFSLCNFSDRLHSKISHLLKNGAKRRWLIFEWSLSEWRMDCGSNQPLQFKAYKSIKVLTLNLVYRLPVTWHKGRETGGFPNSWSELGNRVWWFSGFHIEGPVKYPNYFTPTRNFYPNEFHTNPYPKIT